MSVRSELFLLMNVENVAIWDASSMMNKQNPMVPAIINQSFIPVLIRSIIKIAGLIMVSEPGSLGFVILRPERWYMMGYRSTPALTRWP